MSVAPLAARSEDVKKPSGAAIYQAKCASCHGAEGQGSEDYPQALAGDRSVEQLSRLISKTMPEDEPGTCAGPDAEAVAAYLHGAFYSVEARERNTPPRIALARLTVGQYRNAVTDLIGSFRETSQRDDRRGLQARYYKKKRQKDVALERIDPEIRFDFGTGAPDAPDIDPVEFTIVWQGSVLAPDSGGYEFVVRTGNAFKLWVNDHDRPLIDASVKSGEDTEFRAPIKLLGGRSYYLKLEFTKGTAGVEDKKQLAKRPPVHAGVALEWKVPNRVAEVIPERLLSPATPSEVFVLETAFPPDDRSTGYERGTSISKSWDQATTDAAVEVATYVAGHLRAVSGVGENAPDRADMLRRFCRKFAEAAFRQPLSDQARQIYVDRQFAEGRDPVAAVTRSVLLTMKSPRFLYREVGGESDSFNVASRISFALWDAPPDAVLREAAANGQLKTREQVVTQAERMLDDPRTRSKLRDFFLRWLRVDQIPDITKDPTAHPGFDAAIASDLRTSLDLLLDEVAWSEASDFRQLLLGDGVYLNGRMAPYYGADLPPDAPFRKWPLDPDDRAGVLTHPYLMSSFAYTAETSPIHRGVFLTRSLLGRNLKPPPEAVAPLSPSLHASLSTRERVNLQTSPASCMTCHGTINPLGFGMEHFDASGRFRADERGKPINAAGQYEPPSGSPIPYDGARGLAQVLAESEEVHAAFVRHLFHHMVKQPINAFGSGVQADLTRRFRDRNFHIRGLMVEIVVQTAFPPVIASKP